ncbi:MAG TPA: hypothetical protein VIJ75_04835 [Hanamia sp.]
MKELTIDDLKIVQEFQHVPDEQLQWLIQQGETMELEKDEVLFNVGDPVNVCYVLLDGKMRICAVNQKELRMIDPG